MKQVKVHIMNKFKSQALHITGIKYWKASWSGNPPFINHALWNIGILLHKQTIRAKHFGPECMFWILLTWLSYHSIFQNVIAYPRINEQFHIKGCPQMTLSFFSDILIPLSPKSQLFYIYANRFYTDILRETKFWSHF